MNDFEQMRMVPGEDPDELVGRAVDRWTPVARWCLFSGGNDSTVLAHRMRGQYDGLAWVDTGTAVPGVAEFIAEYAAWVEAPLRVLSAGDAFRVLVLGDDVWWQRYAEERDDFPDLTIDGMEAWDRTRYGQGAGVIRTGEHKGMNLGQYPHGFPGPGGHGRAFDRLKGRAIEAFTAALKVGARRDDYVLYLSGIRRDESPRRAKRHALSHHRGSCYVAPLIDWTRHDMGRYRVAHEIPQSPAAALLHRSGECNCGAFATAGEERGMMLLFYREWFEATIAPLEAEAERRGIRWCRWGGYDLDGIRTNDESEEQGGLCQDCPVQLGLTV